VNGYGETMAMRIHGMRNNWHNFYKPRLIAELKGLPAEVSETWLAIVFQLKLAALVALLGWVTKNLEKMEAN
jgi:hypothetical protein